MKTSDFLENCTTALATASGRGIDVVCFTIRNETPKETSSIVSPQRLAPSKHDNRSGPRPGWPLLESVGADPATRGNFDDEPQGLGFDQGDRGGQRVGQVVDARPRGSACLEVLAQPR